MKFGKQVALVALVLASTVPAAAQFRTGSVSPSLGLLSIPEVRKELKLSDAQSSQVTKVQVGAKGDLLKTIRGFKDVPNQDRRKKFESFRSDLDRKVVLILDPGQRKRLHELQLQQAGARALLMPDVSAELRLTSAQHAKIAAITRDEQANIRALYQSAGKINTPASQEEARGKAVTIQAQTDSALYDVLTSEQKKQFRVMQGAPFKFPERKAPGVTVSSSAQAAKPAAKK